MAKFQIVGRKANKGSDYKKIFYKYPDENGFGNDRLIAIQTQPSRDKDDHRRPPAFFRVETGTTTGMVAADSTNTTATLSRLMYWGP